jgi:TolB-like protein/Tfp pilus assembly protein PilF
MKRCPECRRDYFDDSLLYCLDDGSALLEGPASGDESATAILPAPHSTGEARTRTYDSGIAVRPPEPKRNYVIPGALAILLIATVGIGSYFYFRSEQAEINSIAVLPFVNESENPEIEYLSDGMTDTLINNLSRIPKLSVKARSSVFRYKGKDVEPQKVAADLNVQAIVNGRVMQRGDNLTLNLEVVDARSGDQIWGEQYVRKVGDLVSLQSEIARDVSNKLRQKLSGADTERVSKRGTDNTEAYQQYLKGRFHWNKRTIEDINKSIEHFQKAIEIDPSYALAYAGLADGYVVIPSYSGNRSKEAFPKARAAAMKALEIDNSLPEAHTTLADVLYEFDWNFQEAEVEFKRAIELDPNYATAHHWYGEFLMSMNRQDEALAEMKRAQECDPLSMIINSMLGLIHGIRGEFDAAESQLKKTIEMDPNFPRAHLFLAQIYEEQGKFEAAFDEYEKSLVLSGMPADVVAREYGALRNAYKTSGADGFRRARLAAIEKLLSSDSDLKPPYAVVAGGYVEIGDHERAFQYLERSFQAREPEILRILEKSFDPVRSDPRFQDLVRRIGLPQ